MTSVSTKLRGHPSDWNMTLLLLLGIRVVVTRTAADEKARCNRDTTFDMDILISEIDLSESVLGVPRSTGREWKGPSRDKY